MRLKVKQIRSLLELNEAQQICKFFACAIVVLLSAGWFYNCVRLHFNAYNNFSIYAADDIADYNQAAWNTANGRFFQYNDRAEKAILENKDIKTINLHSNFIFLFICLSYLILPHFSSFILLQSLFIAFSIIVLYLLARELLTEKIILPLLIALIYTQYFPLTSAAHFFHPEEFSIFFIFLAFYFYLKNNIWLTLVFSVLSISCREEAGLIFLVLGLVSYFNAGKKKYCLPLVSVGMGSYLFIKLFLTKAVISPEIFKTHYGYLGDTLFDKLKNIIFHPSLFVNNILKPDRTALFRDIFAPLLYLPFLSPVLFLPGAVILAEVMLSNSWSMGSLRWQPWYLCLLIPFVFIALTGAFEKIYRLDKPLDKLLKNRFFSKKNLYVPGKILSFTLIGLLFLYSYIVNFRLTQANNNALRDYFSINRYWRNDTFEVLSGINKEAKVACSLKLMPMLSARRNILPLAQLTPRIVNQGTYDIIILSEGDYTPDIDNYFALMKDANLYEKAYSAPYMTVFTKKDSAMPLEGWRFNLISEIKKSAVRHNYMFSNFTDYASILENSDALEYSKLITQLYQNKKLYYTALETVALTTDTNTQPFVSYRPLQKGDNYILAFAAKTQKSTDVIYVNKPSDTEKEWDEIKIDHKLRLFMLPFKVSEEKPSCIVKMQINRGCSVLTPILLRSPAPEAGHFQAEPIFETTVDNYKFSYNPWFRCEDFQQEAGRYEFLVRQIEKNPLLYAMKLIKLTLPADLYKYFWVKDCRISSQILAIRY